MFSIIRPHACGDENKKLPCTSVHCAPISALRERDQTILSRLYGLKGEKAMTVSELAIAMGFTQRHIRQLRDRALNCLQKEKDVKNG